MHKRRATHPVARHHAVPLAALLLGGSAIGGLAHAQQAASADPTEQITVIGTSPLLGSGVDPSKLPTTSITIGAAAVSATGPASASRALDENDSSVNLDEAVGNSFQPNLLFRGFEASPLAGDAQGIAVYLNGTRFNASFADTTNWDLIPDLAIQQIDLVGADPAFGLNALGGAVSVRLKNGFDNPGGEIEAYGGSFGTVQLSGQYGYSKGDYAAYIAATGENDSGWRENSPSQARQLYANGAWRNADSKIDLAVIYANNNLVGNGTTPVQLIDADRAAVFTYPDETRNRYVRGILSGTSNLSDYISVQGNAYGSYLDQLTFNGDAGDEAVCDDPTYVCEDDGVTLLTDRGGNPILNVIHNSPYYTKDGFADFANGGPYSVLNVTDTRSVSYGASGQITDSQPLLGRENHLVVGASFDGAVSNFSAETYLGGFTLDRDYISYPNILIDQADNSISPVAVRVSNDYTGVYVTDTLAVLPSLFATFAGRFNHAQVDLTDLIGTALDGNHGFNRFNPAFGLRYKVTPQLSVYANYAESNRAPTPSELSCANSNSPCSLTNFFVGDPDLKQVVSHSVEAGIDDKMHFGHDLLTLHAGYFRTQNNDDIEFVTAATIGRAYFRNVGTTLRQGAEASARYHTPLYEVFASYTYTAATFESALLLNNASNPAADENGNYLVTPGDSLPGIPRHTAKFGGSIAATPTWKVGITGTAATGQYLFGDESNQSPKTSGYVVFNFDTEWQVTKSLQLFGQIRNMLGARYETYGTFAPTSDVPIVEAPGAANPRALTPGAPVAGYGGVRYTF